ncbi:hypothetical protein QEH52_19750 [Coraliomargarita sp. SDUM461003]|uniref:YcxB-like protein domain-containing protein n=1 Tax=Thalassobacterium maritimum TaxID=3041265 RepID=A0ABU1B047_9BACT|nr:hypothetical protein [Coraliomargarita sp. SDUM461003]MDQ8209763.1 hypothetical protein [Coraliomargarita sp. SDUM461003]
MRIHLTNFCYDPVEHVIRTKGRKEFTRPTIIFSGCLFALILILAPFFEIEWYFAFLGLLPLLGLLRPLRTKVLFSKEGEVVRFFEIGRTVELNPKKELHCQSTVKHGDSYFTNIFYGGASDRVSLIESTDFIAEEDFKKMFGFLFEELNYTFIEKPKN